LKVVLKVLDEATKELSQILNTCVFSSHNNSPCLNTAIPKKLKCQNKCQIDGVQEMLLNLQIKLDDYQKTRPALCKIFNEAFKI